MTYVLLFNSHYICCLQQTNTTTHSVVSVGSETWRSVHSGKLPLKQNQRPCWRTCRETVRVSVLHSWKDASLYFTVLYNWECTWSSKTRGHTCLLNTPTDWLTLSHNDASVPGHTRVDAMREHILLLFKKKVSLCLVQKTLSVFPLFIRSEPEVGLSLDKWVRQRRRKRWGIAQENVRKPIFTESEKVVTSQTNKGQM